MLGENYKRDEQTQEAILRRICGSPNLQPAREAHRPNSRLGRIRLEPLVKKESSSREQKREKGRPQTPRKAAVQECASPRLENLSPCPEKKLFKGFSGAELDAALLGEFSPNVEEHLLYQADIAAWHAQNKSCRKSPLETLIQSPVGMRTPEELRALPYIYSPVPPPAAKPSRLPRPISLHMLAKLGAQAYIVPGSKIPRLKSLNKKRRPAEADVHNSTAHRWTPEDQPKPAGKRVPPMVFMYKSVEQMPLWRAKKIEALKAASALAEHHPDVLLPGLHICQTTIQKPVVPVPLDKVLPNATPSPPILYMQFVGSWTLDGREGPSKRGTGRATGLRRGVRQLSLSLLVTNVLVLGVQAQYSVTLSSQSLCAVTGSTIKISCRFTPPDSSRVREREWYQLQSSGEERVLSTDPQYSARVSVSTEQNNCELTVRDVR
ncbi:hypothetical protein NFI96_009831, partial [Prochilodus magdalenae]